MIVSSVCFAVAAAAAAESVEGLKSAAQSAPKCLDFPENCPADSPLFAAGISAAAAELTTGFAGVVVPLH